MLRAALRARPPPVALYCRPQLRLLSHKPALLLPPPRPLTLGARLLSHKPALLLPTPRPLTLGARLLSHKPALLLPTPRPPLTLGARLLSHKPPPRSSSALSRAAAEPLTLPPWVPCAASLSRGLASAAEAAPEAVDPMRKWAMRCGHGAFVMLACMYFMTDVVLLRVLGIVANLLDTAYCSKVDPKGPMWLNIRWAILYVLINVVQLGMLYSEMRSVDLDPELSETYRAHFEAHGISQSQFRKLITSAEPTVYAAGQRIQSEGEEADRLVLMTSGAAVISEAGVQVAVVDSTFSGSMAFLVDEDSTYQATFVAQGEVRGYVWAAEDLKGVLRRNPSLAVSVRAMLQDELLKFNKGALSYARLGSYTQLLKGVVVDGKINDEERRYIEHFRSRQHITAAEHAECLADAGWTLDEWRAGVGPDWAATRLRSGSSVREAR